VWVTNFEDRTVLAAMATWSPVPPEPRPFFSLPVGRSTVTRGAQANVVSLLPASW
jgi:hypothetical protein